MRARWFLPIYLCILFVLFSSCSTVAPATKSTPLPTYTISPTQTQLPTPTSTQTPVPTPFAGISNQLVAYQEELFGHIFVSDIYGRDPINITKEPKGYKDLIGWSPDGEWIVFIKTNFNPYGSILYSSDAEVWVSNPDGTKKYYLGNNDGREIFWAPDSSFVILADYSERDSLPDAYLIYNTSGFEKKVLGKFSNINGYSPKGFFHSFDSSNEEPIINIMDLEGNIINSYQYSDRLNPVMEPCEIDSVNYTSSTGIWSWFPDFNRFLEVIFCGTPIHPSDNVVILETTVGDEITSRAFAWSSNRGRPVISPNGKWILNKEWGADNQSCGILDSEFNRISEFQCNNPQWSPDGNIVIDSLKISEENIPSIVFIDPLINEITQANSLQWLTNSSDTMEQALWKIQPHN